MTAASDYLEDTLLDEVLSATDYTPPSTVYVALFTSDSGGLEGNDLNNATEVSGGSYSRQSISFGAASGGSASNDADVSFPQATADWGTVTHAAIMDANTGGNVLLHGALNNSREILNGDTFEIKTGDFTVSLD